VLSALPSIQVHSKEYSLEAVAVALDGLSNAGHECQNAETGAVTRKVDYEYLEELSSIQPMSILGAGVCPP
jgi:hypothetical protein